MISTAILRRIKEILSIAKNDEPQAERLILSLIERDPAFLRQLVDPYLKGIMVHAISIARNEQGMAGKSFQGSKGASAGMGMDGLVDQLTQNLGKPDVPPPAYSARQAAAIKAVAFAQAKRRKETDR